MFQPIGASFFQGERKGKEGGKGPSATRKGRKLLLGQEKKKEKKKKGREENFSSRAREEESRNPSLERKSIGAFCLSFFSKIRGEGGGGGIFF